LRNKPRAFAIAAALSFACVFARAAAIDLPKTDDFVDDYAGVIAATDRASVGDTLAKILASYNEHVCFVTVSSTADVAPGSDVEAMAASIYGGWHIGEKTGRGMVILISIKDRNVAIELGNEDKAMYDQVMKEVVKKHMLPEFKDGDYGRGIYEGARALSTLMQERASFSGRMTKSLPLLLGILALAAAAFYFIRLAVKAPVSTDIMEKQRAGDRSGQKPGDFGGGAAGNW
jgi:uncharacterized membrane protein YgcG